MLFLITFKKLYVQIFLYLLGHWILPLHYLHPKIMNHISPLPLQPLTIETYHCRHVRKPFNTTLSILKINIALNCTIRSSPKPYRHINYITSPRTSPSTFYPPPPLCNQFLCNFPINDYNLLVLIHVWCEIIIPKSYTLSLKIYWWIPIGPCHLRQKLHTLLPQLHPFYSYLLRVGTPCPSHTHVCKASWGTSNSGWVVLKIRNMNLTRLDPNVVLTLCCPTMWGYPRFFLLLPVRFKEI